MDAEGKRPLLRAVYKWIFLPFEKSIAAISALIIAYLEIVKRCKRAENE